MVRDNEVTTGEFVVSQKRKLRRIKKLKRNEAKKLKRKEAKKSFISFAKRSEKEAKRFLFCFVSLPSEKNKKRKWDTLHLTMEELLYRVAQGGELY